MCKRLISLGLTCALAVLGLTFATSACSGCSNGTAQPQYAPAAVLVSSSSGCGSGGSTPKPTPTNVIEANCTRDFEGPDNIPVGTVTAWISFTCGINLTAVTLVITIWHSGGGNVSVGDKPEATQTCESIETGSCTVTVKCTEGNYIAAFSLTATVDDKVVTDSATSDKQTYSAGDCTV